MFRIIKERFHQGAHTMRYPNGPAPALPERFRGLPRITDRPCPPGCNSCIETCPTDAITKSPDNRLSIDLGRCLFCSICQSNCPQGTIAFSKDYRLAASRREDLTISSRKELVLAQALHKKILRLFGRSLKLRQVSAAGCNGCEADVNVLGTIGWDIGRFGIQMVAAPRHADGILVTGCVSANMRIALQKTWEAVPAPKIVIAVGACAIAGGPFLMNPQQHCGAASFVPVDLFIPGCPPHPLTILDGILRLLGRLEKDSERSRPAEAG